MHIFIYMYIYICIEREKDCPTDRATDCPTDLDYPTDRLTPTVQCICCLILRFPLHVYYKESMSVINAPAGG